MFSSTEFGNHKCFFALLIVSLFVSACSSKPKSFPAIFPQFEPISVDNFNALEEITRLGQGKIQDIALSLTGKVFAVSSPTGIYFYNAETGENFLTVEENIVLTFDYDGSLIVHNPGALAFNYDGSLIAIASKNINTSIRIMKLEGDELITVKQLYEVPIAHEVFEMKFSQDGQQLYVHSGASVSVKCDGPENSYALHDLSTDSTHIFNNVLFETHSCHFSGNTTRFTQDGKFLLNLPGGGYYRSFLIDAATGRVLRKGEGVNFKDGNNIFDISPDGSVLAVFSEASTGNPIKLIDSTSGDILSTVQEKILFFLDETKQVRHLYQPEIDVDKLGVWQDENLICTMDIQHYQTIDPTHSYLVTLSNWHFDIWDIDQCTISAQVNNDFNPIYMASYTDRAFSSDGSYLALFSPFSHENLRVWDFSLDNAFEIQKPLPEEISSLPDRASIAFIPNTDILVINTDKGTTFFDVQKWELVETEANLSQLNFLHWTDIISVDGELLIRLLPNKDRVLFLKAENDAYLGELEPPFQFTDIVFSPDGRLLVFISGDGTLHVWGVKKDEVSTN